VLRFGRAGYGFDITGELGAHRGAPPIEGGVGGAASEESYMPAPSPKSLTNFHSRD